MTADAIGTDGKEHTSCFIRFDDALEVFFDGFENVITPYLNTDKDKFLYALLHEQWGLCVYLCTHAGRNERFIVMRPDEVDMELFLDSICQKSDEISPARMYLDKPFVQSLLSTLDSEWDRVVARVLLAVDRSRKQLEILGIDSREISRNVEKVSNFPINFNRSRKYFQDLNQDGLVSFCRLQVRVVFMVNLGLLVII